MYKLKVKKDDFIQKFYFNTLEEVADYIKNICCASTLKEILKAQKELNIRFYLSYKKNN